MSRILYGFSIVTIGVAILLIVFGGALNWESLDTSNVKFETVTGVVTAFVIIAVTIERAGQVLITLTSNQEKKKELQQAISLSNKEIVRLSDERKYQISFSNSLTQTTMLAATDTTMPQITAAVDYAQTQTDQLQAKIEAQAAKRKQKKEELDGIEEKEDKTHLQVALPLSILVAISGLHFLESLFGVHPTTEFYITDPEQLTALMEKVPTAEIIKDIKVTGQVGGEAVKDQAGKSIEAFKTELSKTYKAADMTQLWTFRAVDFIVTVLLLTGGSAGLRNLLKMIGKKDEA